MPRDVEIIDCPGLANWCLKQNIDRIQVPLYSKFEVLQLIVSSKLKFVLYETHAPTEKSESLLLTCQVILGNELIVSNSWVKIKQWLDDLTSTEEGLSTGTDELLQPWPQVCFSNSWRYSVDRAPSEPKLTIWGCSRTSFHGLRHLPRAKSVRHLVVKDCPGLRSVPTGTFPLTLRSLMVDSCEDLGYLMIERKEKRRAFERQFGNNAQLELQLVNCPNLARVVGLNGDVVPATLRIERCPKLLDWLRKERLMEPKKLNLCDDSACCISTVWCWRRLQDLSIPIAWASPSDSSSQPLVQITAEPSVWISTPY